MSRRILQFQRAVAQRRRKGTPLGDIFPTARVKGTGKTQIVQTTTDEAGNTNSTRMPGVKTAAIVTEPMKTEKQARLRAALKI
jgi:hypothetical protein